MTFPAADINLEKWLRSRRSVRRFVGRKVPHKLVVRLLETATYAPNAHNRQPWRFAVLETQEAKKRLAHAMAEEFRAALKNEGLSEGEIGSQSFRSSRRIIEAPLGIVLCMDLSVMDEYSDPNRQAGEHVMAAQSVALAGGQLLLAAHALGLGGVWICAPLFVPGVVRMSLALPSTWQAQGMLLLGYPAKMPEQRERVPLDQVTQFL